MFIKALKGTFIKKVITLFVVFTFIWGDSSWAFSLMPVNFSSAPQSSSELLLDKLSSLEQAKIEEVRYYKNQDSPFVIHIQDAHANSNAQKNIEAILEKITKFSKDNESSIWIALEGAKGLIHPEYFDFFKNDVKANDLIISDLLEKGELTGAELFAWEQYKLNQKENSNIHFVGVEDSDVYLKNFQAYKKMMEVKPNADNLVRKLYLQISSKTSNEFNSDLLDFVKTRQKYKLGKHDVTSAQKGDGELSVYLEHLFSRLSNDLQIDLDSSFEQLRFPQLVRFSKMQKALHNLKEIELKQSLEELSAKISAVKKTKEENEWFVAWRDAFAGHAWLDHENSSEIKKTKFSPRHLFESMIRFMNENKIEVELSDQIKNAMKIIVFEYEMDAALLFDEIQQVEDALFEKLIKNDAEKEYVQLFKQLELHEKLFSLELTKSDFKKYQSNQTSNLFDLYLDDQEKINLEGFKSIAEDFYQFADERDQSLFRNTMNTYREYLSPTNEVIKNPKNTVLVLVSGGFHTEGLTELFDEQKISHAVIRPQIYSMDSEDKYHDVMSHKNADLSYYFGVQNPFETHQQALFYRSIIEKVMPYFMEEKKLSYDEMYQVLEESFQGHPLFKAKVKLQQTVIDQKPAFQFRVMNEKNKDAQALVKMLVSADASLHLRLKEVMVRRGTLRSFDYAFSGKKRETVVAQSMSRAELRQTDAKSVDSLGTDLYQIFIQGHEANWLLLAGTIAVAAAVLFGPKLIANSRWYAKQKLQGIENYYQDQPSRLSALFFGVSAERFENDIRYIQNISKKYEAARLNILKLKRQGKRVSEDLEQDAALNKKAKDTLSTILRLMSELLENDPQNKRLAREYHILLDVLENDFLIQAIQSELDSSYRAVTRTKSGVKSELAIIIAKLQRSELRVAEESLALDYEQYRSWPLADLMHSLNNKIGIIMMILEIVSEPDYLKDFEESYFYREVGKSIEDLKSRRMRMPELNRDEALRETVDYFQSVYQVFAEPQLEKEILSFESHERIGDYHQMLLKARQQVIDFTGTWLGLIPAIPMEVSLRSFLEEVTRTVLDHRGDGIKINFNIPDEANRKIFTYPIDLQDVLENLLVNAFHATDPAKTGRQREITISAKYIAVSDTHPEAIEISIQDNGTGMSQDVAGRIFEEGFTTKAQLGSQTQKPSLKIFRGDEESDTAEVEGTGIGMPSVKNKLETRLDGSIRFETEENVGTIFTLTLPMRVSDKAIQPNIKQRAELRVKAEDLTRGTVISNQSTGVRRIVLFNSADAFKNFGRSANLPEHALITLILVEGRSPRINLIDQREALERLNQENSTTLLRQFRDYPEDTRRRFFGMMDSATQALKQIYEAGEPLFIADETGTIKVERLSELEKRVEKIDNDKSPVLRTVLPQPRVQIESPTVDVAEGQLEKYADAIEGLAEHLLASAYTLDNLKVMFPLYMELHDGMDDARDTMGELYKKLDSATEAFLLSRQIDEPWGSSGRKLILKLTNEMLQSRSELRSDEGAESILGALNDSQREALQRYFDDREAHRELVKFLRFDQSTPVVRGNKSIHAEFLLFPEIFDKTDFYVHYGKIGEAWQSVKLEPKKLRWTEYENRTRYLLDFEMPFTEAGEYGVTFFAEPKGAVNQNLTVWQSSNPDDAARIIIDDETSVRSLRWISAFSGESFASSGEAKISFDIDPKSLDRVEFFGRVQKHDAPGFSYEVPLSKKELRPIKGGGYILTIPVDPRENGDYRVDLFARSKDGKDILTSDLKRPALLKIYRSIDEIQSLKSALSSYQAFIDYVNLQMSSASIQDINQFLFDATKNDESLRILVSKYFGILDGIMKREGIESLHNQGLLPIYQILNTLGIGKDITFVTPEGAQAIGGGIGSVIRGLPDSLAEAGVPITIITNLYEENLKNKHRSAEEVLADGFEIHGKVVKPVEIGTVDIPYGPIYFSGTKNIQTPSYTITAKVYLAENNGVRYLLLRHPEMANRLYPDMSSSETLKRAIFLSRGALEIAKKKFEYGDGQVLNLQPSTMFSHDWVAGLISYLNTVDDTYLADFKLQNMKVGHFIHNFSYQGRIFVNEDGYRDIWGLLNVGDQHFFGLADPNDLNFLNPTAASVTYSTAGLWAPSAPYAREIVTADGGQGLHYLLRRRIDDLSGISNGIELQSARKTFWKTGIVAEQLTQYDRAENLSSLSASKRVERLKKYRAEILSGASGKLNDELSKFDELDEDAFVDAIPHLKKLALKAAQVEYGLKEDDDAILFSFVGRVAEQKGLQLLAEKGASGKSILEEILDKYPKAQFIFGGPPAPGDAEMQDFLKLVNELAQRYPDRLHARLEMVPPSEALAIMFASHYFLMPSKYEPGGITQLEAMAGGTVVIGRKTGGIAATIFDYDLDQERGNGFLFQDFSGVAFQKAIENAVEAFIAEPALKETLLLRTLRQKTDWFFRVVPSYLAFLQSSAGALKHNYPHFRSVVRALSQTKVVRSELRTEEVELKDPPYGGFAINLYRGDPDKVAPEPLNTLERKINLRSGENVSFFFNVNTQSAISNVEDLILARAYVRKGEDEEFEEGDVLELLEDFENGDYRFGYELPTDFSGELTFQYSVDGGETWQWANQGREENYVISRINTKDIFESTERKLERVKSVLWTKSRIARLESGSVDLIFNIIKRSFPPEHILAESVSVERLALEFEHAFYNYLDFTRDSHASSVMTAFNPEKVQLSELIVATQSRIGVTDLIRSVIEKKGYTVAYDEKAARFNDVATGKKITVYFYEIHDAKNRALDKSEVSELITDIKSALAEHDRKFEQELHVKVSAKTGDMILQGKVGIVRHLPGNLESVASDIFATDDGEPMSEEEMAKAVDEDLKRLENAVEVLEQSMRLGPTLMPKNGIQVTDGLLSKMMTYIQSLKDEAYSIAMRAVTPVERADGKRFRISQGIHRQSALNIFLNLAEEHTRLVREDRLLPLGAERMTAEEMEYTQEFVVHTLRQNFALVGEDDKRDEKDQKIKDEVERFRNAVKKAQGNIQVNDDLAQRLSGIQNFVNTYIQQVEQNIVGDIDYSLDPLYGEIKQMPIIALRAIETVVIPQINQLKNVGGSINLGIATDAESFFKQVIAAMRGQENSDLIGTTSIESQDKEEVVIFAKELNPWKMMQLMHDYKIKAVVTTGASIATHWVLVAENSKIPVLTVDEANPLFDISDPTWAQQEVIIDGVKKVMILNANPQTYDQYVPKLREHETLRRLAQKVDPSTLPIKLAANADTLPEVQNAMDDGVDDVGLVRTEYQFGAENQKLRKYLERYREMESEAGISENASPVQRMRFARALGSDEVLNQARLDLISFFKNDFYTRMAAAVGVGTITFRTFDMQRDKEEGDSTFKKLLNAEQKYGPDFYQTPLGESLLKIQLTALLQANAEVARGQIRILFPMFTHPNDLLKQIDRESWSAFESQSDQPKLNKKALDGIVFMRQLFSQVQASVAEDAGFREEVLKLDAFRVSEGLKAQEDALHERSYADRIKETKVGLMIETVEALENLREILKKFDFVSVGSNDLTISLFRELGIDRESETSRDFFNKLKLRLIKAIRERILKVVSEFNAQLKEDQRPVSVTICGAAACTDTFALVMSDAVPGNVEFKLSGSSLYASAIRAMLAALEKEDTEFLREMMESDESEAVLDVLLQNKVAEVLIKIRDRRLKSDDFRAEYAKVRRGLADSSETALGAATGEDIAKLKREMLLRTREIELARARIEGQAAGNQVKIRQPFLLGSRGFHTLPASYMAAFKSRKKGVESIRFFPLGADENFEGIELTNILNLGNRNTGVFQPGYIEVSGSEALVQDVFSELTESNPMKESDGSRAFENQFSIGEFSKDENFSESIELLMEQVMTLTMMNPDLKIYVKASTSESYTTLDLDHLSEVTEIKTGAIKFVVVGSGHEAVMKTIGKLFTTPTVALISSETMRSELRESGVISSTAEFGDFLLTERHEFFVTNGVFENRLATTVTLANSLEGLHDAPHIASFLPGQVEIFSDGVFTEIAATEFAQMWIHHDVVSHLRQDQARIDNADLDALRKLIQNEKAQQKVEPLEQGGTVHLQLKALPEDLNIFIPILAVLVDLHSTLNLNVANMSEEEAALNQKRILDFASERGVKLKSGQFNLFAVTNQIFESVPNAMLKQGERHGLIAENDDIHSFERRKSGIYLFELEKAAFDDPKLFSANLITVITAIALDRNLGDNYLDARSPRSMNPELFGSVAESLAIFFAASARLAASA